MWVSESGAMYNRNDKTFVFKITTIFFYSNNGIVTAITIYTVCNPQVMDFMEKSKETVMALNVT